MKTAKNLALILLAGILALLTLSAAPGQQADSSAPPEQVTKLIFIHHSTGENWLRDDYGLLGKTLGQNNYFVSDTNYGWGPDGIGDRTDIPNWTEWFASEATPKYMTALFKENGQNADYTRSLADPGGENEIIVFKSCFPNSALEGQPGDPPDPEGWLSVGHSKFVYNEILRYFGTRPDKLFIVVSAPPLSDGTFAKNARAFNEWLRNDWLRENNYTLNNVAVFDFYNVLTSPDAHHRFVNGQVEHIIGNKNTLQYPSGDDHPSTSGSQKASEEFVPLLNVFYHRWKNAGPGVPIVQNTTVAPTDTATLPASESPPSKIAGLLDDFESGPPSGASGWEGYFQDNTDTRLICTPEAGNAHSGAASLKFEFDVSVNSWATCGFYFNDVQNWSAGQGISFYLRASHANLPIDVNLYGGSPGARSSYIFRLQTPPGSVNDWSLVEIPWTSILRVEWEENPGTPINPAEITGFSIGLSTPEQERISASLWLDDLSLLSETTTPPSTKPAPTAISATSPVANTPPSAASEPGSGARNLPCIGSTLLPILLGGFVWLQKSKHLPQP